MLSGNTILTIITKFGILFSNFALVVFSTRMWGSEGRGKIAYLITSILIITVISNIFCGSTIAYNTSKFRRESLLTISLAGALFTTLAGAIVYTIVFGSGYFFPVFLISLLMSLTNSVSSWWLGKNNLKKYNLLTLLSPISILISLLILYFIFNKTTLETFFHAYYAGLSAVLLLGFIGLALHESFKVPALAFNDTMVILKYGISNEFNYLIQFLNYRLSYFLIASMLSISSLGFFSVAVSISEAVWVISRSMSSVHFSNIINSDDPIKSREETITFAKQSLIISFILLATAVIIPESVYQAIFGDEFGEVRKYVLYLAPGIIAIAVSNLFGHYFAGTGRLDLVRNKSLLGLAATLVLLPVLLKKYLLTGVCISLDISYILSSLYLWFHFRKTLKKNNSVFTKGSILQ